MALSLLTSSMTLRSESRAWILEDEIGEKECEGGGIS
jgi:hypothetical protein